MIRKDLHTLHAVRADLPQMIQEAPEPFQILFVRCDSRNQNVANPHFLPVNCQIDCKIPDVVIDPSGQFLMLPAIDLLQIQKKQVRHLHQFIELLQFRIRF